MATKKSEHGVSHITKSTGNIFADLGFEKAEAKKMLAEVDAEIDAALALKVKMAEEVKHWMKAEKLRQADAALVLRVTRPRVSDLVNLKVTKFTLDTLVNMLTRIGKSVSFTVEPDDNRAHAARR